IASASSHARPTSSPGPNQPPTVPVTLMYGPVLPTIPCRPAPTGHPDTTRSSATVVSCPKSDLSGAIRQDASPNVTDLSADFGSLTCTYRIHSRSTASGQESGAPAT